MDFIKIDDIEVFAYHGVFDFEKINGQNFYISVKIGVKSLTDCDDLNETIDYGMVAKMIDSYVRETKFNLIESVATGIADMILSNFEIAEQIEVTIKKPDAPIPLKFGNVMVNVIRRKHIAYIALGSNMGDREKYLNMAVESLRNNAKCEVLKVSSFINTAPYGVLDQADFLNGVVKIKTLLSPNQLLDLCHEIENKANRVRTRRWGERTLDLDVILFDDEIINEENLIIPHLELHMRDFVLKPLVEIDPGVVHPVLHKTAYTLLKELK